MAAIETGARVADAMRAEVLACPADTPLELVAELMAAEEVHCVVVEGTDGTGRDWGIVSDLDLVAAGAIDGATAASSAASEFLTIPPDESLARAAQMMVEHETAHLVVVDPVSDRPIGVLSTLDVARLIASGSG